MKVEIAFDLSANGQGDFFTLDDATKGVLDNTTYLLGGDFLVDVTNYTRSVSTKRGRSRTLEKFTAGAGNLVLDNRLRTFDPTYSVGPYDGSDTYDASSSYDVTGSPYYGSILPRKQVKVSLNDQTLYVGLVADWNFGYDLGGDSTVAVSCTDGFAILAGQTRTAGTATPQAAGARIAAVLTEAGWPATLRTLDTGQASLGADVVTDTTNVLAYLQQVGVTEPGAVFIGKGGSLTFKDRASLQTPTSGVTFGTGGVPFTDIGVDVGIESLVTRVVVNYTGGTVTMEDTTASAAYGAIEQSYDTLLGSEADATALANWLLSLYASPQYRVNHLSVNLAGLTSAQVLTILGLELGDVATVTFTPNSVGPALSELVTIDGIEHAADPGNHVVTFTLSQTHGAFVLDSATFGLLDIDVLGF